MGVRNARQRFAATFAAGALVATVFGVQPVAAASDTSTPDSTAPVASAPGSRVLANGIVYSTHKASGPNKVKPITIDPEVATLDVALAGPQFPSWSRTSTMGSNHNAVAAINGDFGFSPGRPAHLFAEDGRMVQTSLLGADGKVFAADEDGSGAWADNPKVKITATRVSNGNTIGVDRWNQGSPRSSEASMFSVEGGTLEKPGSGCSIRLQPSAAPRWTTGRTAVIRDYTASSSGCGSAIPLNGGLVLVGQSGTPKGNAIKAINNGDTVQVSWSLGWRGTLDAIGGSPILLNNGNVKVTNCSDYLCQRHPRTAVGVKANGDVLFMQVDGRSSKSVGMTLVQLAQEMKKRGAVNAINLDGGGSSTMWIRGSGVVNRPSDGSERSVSSALIVYDRKDAGEPGTLTSAPISTGIPFVDTALAAEDQQAGFDAAVADSASTGGLLDYLANRDRTLTRDDGINDILGRFRAAAQD